MSLVDRLRGVSISYGVTEICNQAADLIESQREELRRMTEDRDRSIAHIAELERSRELQKAVATAALDQRDAMAALLEEKNQGPSSMRESK